MRIKALVSTASLVLLLGVFNAPPAHADSPCWSWTQDLGWPDDPIKYAKVCWQPVGDLVFVWDLYDDPGDMWNVRVQNETNYPAEGLPRKTRWCGPNDHEWLETYDSCNYDHREDSCTRVRPYEQYGSDNTVTRRWGNWSPWVSVSTGQTC